MCLIAMGTMKKCNIICVTGLNEAKLRTIAQLLPELEQVTLVLLLQE
jgi:hypothetical protein